MNRIWNYWNPQPLTGLAERISARAVQVREHKEFLATMHHRGLVPEVWIEMRLGPALQVLRELLDRHPGCQWTYEWIDEPVQLRIGFVEAKYAVMFRLMLP